MFITAFADDQHHGWDQETGLPTAAHFGNALQVWAIAQNRVRITVAEAAMAFNVTPQIIAAAVEAHHWMFLDGSDDAPLGDRIIQHEGE